MTAPLTDQQLADRIAEATIEHGLDLDHTSADGDNPCKCGDWIDDWDAHWAELAVAIVQPELDRLRAELEQTRQQLEAAHCRLHLVSDRLEQVTTDVDPSGFAGDIGPWLDGPLHPSHLADYRAAQAAEATR